MTAKFQSKQKRNSRFLFNQSIGQKFPPHLPSIYHYHCLTNTANPAFC
ncbi:hypothetical protein [Histophilus somni]|nr:hypothetical protein [Histophilus somni]